MDAHDTVTVEEGDRYPLRPPSLCISSVMAASQSPKLLVKVRVLGGTPIQCTYRLSVRTSGFHPGKRGSIPRRCSN